jgi:hypothetical protein
MQIVLDIKPHVVLSVLDNKELWDVTSSSTGASTFTHRASKSDKVVLRLRAEGLLSQMTTGTVEWSGQHGAPPTLVTGKVEGPVAAAAPPSKWSTVIGGGMSWLMDDYADFEVDEERLVVKNDSRWRATALTGIAFNVWNNGGIFVGLKYAEGTDSLLDALTLGLTYRIADQLSIVVGASRGQGRELSPGFRRATAKYIEANSDQFSTINARARREELGKLGDYDGLSLTAIGYTGRPITDSWNATVFVGVTFPISIKIGSDK